EDPLGRHFQFGPRDRTVVGVVGDVRVRGLEQPSEPQVYLCYKQIAEGYLFYIPKNLVVRSESSPASLVPAITDIVRQADPDQPISGAQTMDQIVEEQTASRSVQIRVIAAFAVIAFLLAAIGIHGLLSFSVSQRTQEIGVRMALGARSSGIIAMVLRQAVLAAAVGALLGVCLAYAAGRAMGALLADIKPTDPATFASAVGLCVAMTLIGSLVPALRAVAVDPITALRSE
ncbi:MAG TPA: FtsX-like permease family protein, partial [Blastocatellia bacterium]